MIRNDMPPDADCPGAYVFCGNRRQKRSLCTAKGAFGL